MKLECVSDFVILGEKTYPCPISVAMDLVGGKWKAVIIYHLKNGPKRCVVHSFRAQKPC